MGWRAAADVVLLGHLLFILFIVAGGFYARRRRWLIVIHLTTFAYAFTIEALGFRCPLTPLEKALRASAGEAGCDGGFVEHYIVGLIYPGGLTLGVRVTLIVLIVLTTAAAYRRHIQLGLSSFVWPRLRHGKELVSRLMKSSRSSVGSRQV